MSSLEEFRIIFEITDMSKVWKLSQIYLDKQILTAKHHLDLFHYAAASLLNSTHLTSWNGRQFNDKIALNVSEVNSEQGLLNLIAASPIILSGEKTLAKRKHDNLKMLRQIRSELSQELEKMTPAQRKEFFNGAEEFYEGLKKMEKVRAAIAR